MRLQFYVPQTEARSWAPHADYITWDAFLRRVTDVANGLTVMTGAGRWKGADGGYAIEPVYIVDVVIGDECSCGPLEVVRAALWRVFRQYAKQLIGAGEESVLVVEDNEPTLIR